LKSTYLYNDAPFGPPLTYNGLVVGVAESATIEF